ncbi:MAG: restriction endonuclease subunit S [Nitrospira sp.]|nr:restriction endonuclease subunit S [Nitrospira sp.]
MVKKTTWSQKPLSEVVDVNPRLDKPAYRDDLEVSFVPMAAVEAGTGRMDVSRIKSFGSVKKGYTPFKEGDVVFAKITPCMENGKMAVVPKLTNGIGLGSTEFHVLRPHAEIDARYVYYFVSNQGFRREAAHQMTGAVGQKRVPQSFLEEASIPVPILEEQQRIVAEIEKRFSCLDEAVASLKRTKANLKRYKSAVLKAAVEGKLTEDWRKQHPDVEPASKLLERILAERRARWSGKGKYKEPLGPDIAGLPAIPQTWSWSTVESVCSEIIDCPHSTPKWQPEGRVCLRTTEFRPGRLDLSDVRYVSQETYEERILRLKPRENDVVYSREGGILGVACMIPPALSPCLGQRMMLLRSHSLTVPNLLMHWLNSPNLLARVRSLAGGSASPHLNVGDVKAFPVPVVPAVEQKVIVAELERRLSIIDELEATVEANLTRTERLRQATLYSAFSGNLGG